MSEDNDTDFTGLGLLFLVIAGSAFGIWQDSAAAGICLFATFMVVGWMVSE